MRRVDYAAGETFDILAALARTVNAEHRAVEQALNESVRHAIEAGKALIAVKRIVGHGHFGDWLKNHFAGSHRTANHYMFLAGLSPQDSQRVAKMALRAAIKEHRMVHTLMGSGGGMEYYTPTKILDLSVKVM